MKQLILILAFAFSLDASGNQCKLITTIKVGNNFNTLDKETVLKELAKESSKFIYNMNITNLVSHRHSKLGISYSGIKELYTCNK